MNWSKLALGGGIVATGAAGFVAAAALSAGTATEPSKTVTISLSNGATGATGPAGPTGPPGPAGTGGGADSCPTGSTFGELVINHPGGQVSILTCIKN